MSPSSPAARAGPADEEPVHLTLRDAVWCGEDPGGELLKAICARNQVRAFIQDQPPLQVARSGGHAASSGTARASAHEAANSSTLTGRPELIGQTSGSQASRNQARTAAELVSTPRQRATRWRGLGTRRLVRPAGPGPARVVTPGPGQRRQDGAVMRRAVGPPRWPHVAAAQQGHATRRPCRGSCRGSCRHQAAPRRGGGR